MRRGEVYWHSFGRPDKRRPVVVLTRSALVDVLSRISVAACTTTRRGAASEVPIGLDDGMPKECSINLLEVYTLEKDALGPYVTQLADRVMRQVDAALLLTLGVGERLGDG